MMIVGVPADTEQAAGRCGNAEDGLGDHQCGTGDAMQGQLDGWQRCNGAAEQYSREVQQCLSG